MTISEALNSLSRTHLMQDQSMIVQVVVIVGVVGVTKIGEHAWEESMQRGDKELKFMFTEA